MSRLAVGLLGPLTVAADGRDVTPGGPKLRAIVAALALAGGRVVSVDDLLERVWGERLPATARNTLQYHLGVFRKALNALDAGDLLVTREPGYALTCDTDAGRFEELATAGRRLAEAGDHAAAASDLTDALNLWRGRALADLRDFDFADARAVDLEDRRLAVAEAWVDAELACGRAAEAVGPVQELLRENPTREGLWAQLMLALYRTGRQDAALSAYRTARATLDRELGVTPTTDLVDLHQAILRHDPKLTPGATDAGPGRPLTRTTLVTAARTGSGPMLVGPLGEQVSLADPPVVVGRHADCDLVLADERSSRRHAQIEARGDGHAVVELGSMNGTRVNGITVDDELPLRDGDVIEIGRSLVRYLSGR